VHSQITAALRPGVPVVIADMTATTGCDSMGVRALAMAYQPRNRLTHVEAASTTTASPTVNYILWPGFAAAE
jgi:hypothetical protein